jgi:hypothetical protein
MSTGESETTSTREREQAERTTIDKIAPGPDQMPRFDPPTLLVWFGVAGGAFAWAAVHVAGIESSWDRCIPTGTGSVVPLSAWQITIAACGALITLAALSVCVWLFLRTFRIGDVAGMERRGDGAAPPAGRLQFLAMVGLTVNVLALAIIVLAGVGAPVLGPCQQS